jgi:hypothetical protein
MSRRAWRLSARIAALAGGAAMALLSGGVAHADLPPLPITLPSIGTPIVLPTTGSIVVPPAPTGCVTETSFDNTGISPVGTVFRGQSTCGSGVYQPAISGQAVLTDIFGNVVAVGNGYSQTGGLGTSQGQYTLQVAVPSSLSSAGPVPGLDYTISYDTSITLTAPQTWGGPPGAGCSINGQTLHCVITTTYVYVPGTTGGITPG